MIIIDSKRLAWGTTCFVAQIIVGFWFPNPASGLSFAWHVPVWYTVDMYVVSGSVAVAFLHYCTCCFMNENIVSGHKQSHRRAMLPYLYHICRWGQDTDFLAHLMSFCVDLDNRFLQLVITLGITYPSQIRSSFGQLQPFTNTAVWIHPWIWMHTHSLGTFYFGTSGKSQLEGR